MVQDAGFRTHSPIIASVGLSTASFDRRVLSLPAPLQDSILDSEVCAFYQKRMLLNAVIKFVLWSVLALRSAFSLENSFHIGSELGGYVLDITKCFNGFGRIPSMWMMQSNGMTKAHADFWLKSMEKMSRTVFLGGSYSQPRFSTTGCAEGDPIAVCVMVQIGHLGTVL